MRQRDTSSVWTAQPRSESLPNWMRLPSIPPRQGPNPCKAIRGAPRGSADCASSTASTTPACTCCASLHGARCTGTCRSNASDARRTLQALGGPATKTREPVRCGALCCTMDPVAFRCMIIAAGAVGVGAGATRRRPRSTIGSRRHPRQDPTGPDSPLLSARWLVRFSRPWRHARGKRHRHSRLSLMYAGSAGRWRRRLGTRSIW